MNLEDVKSLFDGRLTIWMATADAAGVPNVAPMRQLWWSGQRTLVIGDLFMKTSAENVRTTGRACLAVHDPDAEKAWKMTGSAAYETSGPHYDLAQSELVKKKPDKRFKGVVVFTVEAVYDQMPGPNAGQVVLTLST